MTQTSNVVAGAAVLTPFWLPVLETISDTAAIALPILGVAWLVIQIVGYFLNRKR